MLEVFRSNSRSVVIYVLLGIIILAFILTFNTSGPINGGPGSGPSELADVAGETITLTDLNLGMLFSSDAPDPAASGFEKAQREAQYEGTRMIFSGVPAALADLTPFSADVPPVKHEKVMTELMASVLIAKEAEARGLSVSAAEITQRIMQISRRFQTSFLDDSGEFDTTKYDTFVRFTLQTTKKNFEGFLRREILRDKLAAAVTAGVRVPDSEVADLVRLDAERPRLELVTLDAATVASAVDVSDADADAWAAKNADAIKKAYDAAGERFDKPAAYTLRVLLKKAPAQAAIDAESDTDKKGTMTKERGVARAAADALRAELDAVLAGTTPIASPESLALAEKEQFVKYAEAAAKTAADAAAKAEGPAAADAAAAAADAESAAEAARKALADAKAALGPDGATPKKLTEVAPEEQLAWLSAWFSKRAEGESDHSATKGLGGAFYDPKKADDLKKPPYGEALATAVAAATTDTLAGRVVGPVEGADGFWVAVVEKVKPRELTTLADATRTLGRELLQKERAADKLDELAKSLHAKATEMADKPLTDVVKAWNKDKTGDEDGPAKVTTTEAIGKSPLRALSGGLEAMLGMAAPAFDPDAVPGAGKVPALAKAAWTLTADKALAPEVYSSEDGKRRFVARLAKPEARDDEELKKLKETVRSQLENVRRRQAWASYAQGVLKQARDEGDIDEFEGWLTMRDAARERHLDAVKRAAASKPQIPGLGNLGAALGGGAGGDSPFKIELKPGGEGGEGGEGSDKAAPAKNAE